MTWYWFIEDDQPGCELGSEAEIKSGTWRRFRAGRRGLRSLTLFPFSVSVKGTVRNVWVVAEDLGLGSWDIGLCCRARNLHLLEKNIISATLA